MSEVRRRSLTAPSCTHEEAHYAAAQIRATRGSRSAQMRIWKASHSWANRQLFDRHTCISQAGLMATRPMSMFALLEDAAPDVPWPGTLGVHMLAGPLHSRRRDHVRFWPCGGFGLELPKLNCPRNHALLVRGFGSTAVARTSHRLAREVLGGRGHLISCYQTDRAWVVLPSRRAI